MSLFTPNHDARAIRRQMKIEGLDATTRRRLSEAERGAVALSKRLDKLTNEGRDGAIPIRTADDAELASIVADADSLVDGLGHLEQVFTEDIWSVYYQAYRAVNAERNRRYKERIEERMRRHDAWGDFNRVVSTIGRGMESFVAAIEDYPMDALMVPDEVLSGVPQPVEDVTADAAKELTDKELEDAINKTYEQSHEGSVAFCADEVARMAEVLPKVAAAMSDYRDRLLAKRQHADDVRAILVAERGRRRNAGAEAAARMALRDSIPLAARLAELEQTIDRMREGI